MAFFNKSKYVVNLWNRDGSSSSGNGIVEFLRETLSRLDGKISIKGCIADSGFYNINFIKELEKRSMSYIIGVPLHEVIQREIPLVTDWQEVDTGISVSEFMFQHKDEKWDKDRRYIIIRQEVGMKEDARGKMLKLFKDDYDLAKYRYSCLITSTSDSPLEVWRTYRSRAGDENIIKENTYDFGLEGFALDSFYATEAAMLIRILFYNIINFFRREILPQEESSDTLATLRYKYFVIPALLGRDGHRYILRLGVTSKKLKCKIKWILSKIDQYFSKICKSNAFGNSDLQIT